MRKVYLLYLTGSFLYHITASFPIATDLDEVYSMKKVKWRIPPISCATESRINIRSDLFESFNSKYYLTFSSDDKNRLFIDVTRYREEPDGIHVSLSLKRDDGTEVALTRPSTSLYPDRETIGYLIDRSKYAYCLQIDSKSEKDVSAPSKMMTVTLLTWKGEWDKDKIVASSETKTSDEGNKPSEADYKSISILQKNLEELYLTGKNHDITFKVWFESRIFKAHRNILSAQAPAFADTFEHEGKRNSNDSIVIRDIFFGLSLETFEEFLRYIYTGKVRNLTPRRATFLYKAADKYKIPNLKEMCIEYLKVSLSISDVCRVISFAIEYNELNLLQRAETFFMKHLDETMSTIDCVFLRLHPTQANRLWLKKMKKYSKRQVDLLLKLTEILEF